MDLSLCEYFYQPAGVEGHRCGYCKGSNGSISNGMWTHKLKCQDYQDLIDRGWRRSGKYCYKPIMDKTCCPMYTIRCEVGQFHLSRSQKNVLKKMNSYLQGSQETEKATTKQAQASVSSSAKPVKKPVKPGAGPDPTKAPCKKAKVIRRELKAAKAAATASENPPGQATETLQSKATDKPTVGRKPIEEFINPPQTLAAMANGHKLELKLIQSSPPSREFKATYKSSYELFKKYQMTVHQEKLEDCTEKGFQRFLCDSPLVAEAGPKEWPCGYGSYHQHYLLDGKLIAVAVIDILPKCLSSVYVFYDPDFNFLSLGVYSALREVAMVRELHPHSPDTMLYYYMGYYVHSCQKMRYKGQYYPSFLLCPEQYRFMPIEQCLPKLESNKYSRLCSEIVEQATSEMGSVKVLFQQSLLLYEVFKAIIGDEHDSKVREWMTLVGPSVAQRMILVL